MSFYNAQCTTTASKVFIYIVYLLSNKEKELLASIFFSFLNNIYGKYTQNKLCMLSVIISTLQYIGQQVTTTQNMNAFGRRSWKSNTNKKMRWQMCFHFLLGNNSKYCCVDKAKILWLLPTTCNQRAKS